MKKDGWPERLHEYLEAARTKEFAYGSWDCCLFVADWVLEATGVDHAAALRGYSTQEEAYAIVEKFGSLEKMVTSFLGEPVHPAFAQRGDIVLATAIVPGGEKAPILGICEGLRSHFPSGRGAGCLQLRTLHARLAWKI